LLVAACLTASCHEVERFSVSGSSEPVPLNGPLRLVVHGADLDPLSVTPASVQVRAVDGRRLAHVTAVQGNVIEVLLVIDQSLWAQPPGDVTVLLAGSPSPHGLRGRSGVVLGRSESLGFKLQGSLSASHGPRLVSVGGEAMPVDHEVRFSQQLELVFEGAIDPATILPRSCPLAPRRAGLSLSPLLPACAWRLVGERLELTLDVGEDRGGLRLNTRDLGLRGPQGAAPSPQVRVDLVSGG